MGRGWILAMLVLLLLGGCASTAPLVDDGRELDPDLLASYQLYGQGERALRPALASAAQVAASGKTECDKQWELPFAVATAEGSEGDQRLAWKRALNVDDQLTVIASSPGAQVYEGDRIVRVGRRDGSALNLLEALGEAREDGQPFELVLKTGKRVMVRPFQVCRGYARLAPPTTPKMQDYHWLMTLHPLELPQVQPSTDEMLWAVLWTQGLSEEGGARMKTYHYTMKIGGTLLQLASLASGLGAAAKAADIALSEAKKAAANVVLDFAKQQLIEQGKQLAMQKIREGLQDAAISVTRSQVLAVLQRSAINRGSLGGIGFLASTVWDRADAWAFRRMKELGADPLAGLRLHHKMVQRDLADNAFALDAERLTALTRLAEANGLKTQVRALFDGIDIDSLDIALAAMPLASDRKAFSYELPDELSGGQFSRGLIDGLLHMPAQSGGARR
jgi:hypothetical protein